MVRLKSFSTCSGFASVAMSKSCGSRPSKKSRTQPPTQNAAKPAACNRSTIFVATERIILNLRIINQKSAIQKLATYGKWIYFIAMNARTLICLSLLLFAGCDENSPDTARKKELAVILKSFPKPAIETDDYQENAGWYNSTNRLMLKNFIAKYPETEETYQAEVWLIFGQVNDYIRTWPEQKLLRGKRAQELETIISKS